MNESINSCTNALDQIVFISDFSGRAIIALLAKAYNIDIYVYYCGIGCRLFLLSLSNEPYYP